MNAIVKEYRDLRVQDSLANRNKVYRVTTRLLESMIRMSEATAKLFLSDSVDLKHVEVALDVMRASLTTVDMTQVELVGVVEEDDADAEAPAEGGGGGGGGGGDDDDDAPPGAGGDADAGEAGKGGKKDKASKRDKTKEKKDKAKAQQGGGAGKKKHVISAETFHRTVAKIMDRVLGLGDAHPTREQLLSWYLEGLPSLDAKLLENELRTTRLILGKLIDEGKLLELEGGEGEAPTLFVHPDHAD
jgi:DNA replication licensing factor MCM6